MDNTTFSAMIKDYYAERAEELQLRNRPMLAYLAKMEKFKGKKIPLPVTYADPENVTSDYATAIDATSTGTTESVAFGLVRRRLYNACYIDRETLLTADAGDASFLDAQTTEINNTIEAVSNRLARLGYRTGWGEIATLTAAPSGSTITVSQTDSYAFRKNMWVGFAPTLATSLLRGAGGGTAQYLQVAGTNNRTGVVTFTAAVSSVTGAGGSVASGDIVFTRGDRQNSTTPTQVVPAGVEGWCPDGGPTSTLWFDVDRTQDSMLAGTSFDGSSEQPEDAIIDCAGLMGEIGQQATHCFTSHRQFNKIVKNQRIYTRFRDELTATVGFDAIKIASSNGMITVVADQFCRNDRAVLMNRDAMKLYSVGKAVRIIEDDGLVLRRHPTKDGYNVQVAFLGNFGAHNPAGLATIKLTAV